jgi:hypothetical protein
MHTKNTAPQKNKKLVLNKTTVSSFGSITLSNTRTGGSTKISYVFTC